MSQLCCVLLIVIGTFHFSDTFPQGAPPEACESLSPERGHGVSSQPVHLAPFSVIQHGQAYNPGDKINVEILQHDRNMNFKGFLVQALDAHTHQFIGEFIAGQGMQIMRECAAVTHSDPRPKRAVNLVWQSPTDRNGEVIFRATIVARKEVFYANILAQGAQLYYASSKK